MSPVKPSTFSGSRIAVTALLTAALSGCSLNPFANDDPDPVPTPVQRDEPRPVARSTAPSSASTTYASQPQPQLVERRVPLAAGAPEQYTVQEGDTLWDIASTFLRDPWYWPEVWYVNPQVANPHLIYPGDVLALVSIDGRDVITTVRGSSFRLSPQARVTPLEEAIQTIAFDEVASFINNGLVLEKDQAEALPYILATRENHIIAAAGNDVYIRGGSPTATGSRYSVVHVGDQLVDPDDGDTVGYEATYVGEGIMSRGGDPATVTLTDTTREALRGDRLLPPQENLPMNFFPKAPDYEIDGRIISVVDGVSLIGQYQVVVINRGGRDGLAPGDVLDVYQSGDLVRDRFAGGLDGTFGRGEEVKLPDEQAGTVMVFKVYDRIGYGLVMEATSAIAVLDSVRNPS